MTTEAQVVLPGGEQVHAGTVHFHTKGATASSTFSYADTYLANPGHTRSTRR